MFGGVRSVRRLLEGLGIEEILIGENSVRKKYGV